MWRKNPTDPSTKKFEKKFEKNCVLATNFLRLATQNFSPRTFAESEKSPKKLEKNQKKSPGKSPGKNPQKNFRPPKKPENFQKKSQKNLPDKNLPKII